jgi:uncharacterized protein (DUF2236 family)
MIRQVLRWRWVAMLYGQVTALLLVLDPVAFDGFVVSHRDDRLAHDRIIDTAAALEDVFFGSKAVGQEVIKRIQGIHEGVPAAQVLRHLRLVVTCMFVAIDLLYTAVFGPLAETERQALWRDLVRLTDLIGYNPASAYEPGIPHSREGWVTYLWQLVDAHAMTDDQRELALSVVEFPTVRRLFRPLVRMLVFATIGSAGERVRGLYGMRWRFHQRVLFWLLVKFVRMLIVVAPLGFTQGRIADKLRAYSVKRRVVRPTKRTPSAVLLPARVWCRTVARPILIHCWRIVTPPHVVPWVWAVLVFEDDSGPRALLVRERDRARGLPGLLGLGWRMTDPGLPGGRRRRNRSAKDAIRRHVARRLGIEVPAAAWRKLGEPFEFRDRFGRTRSVQCLIAAVPTTVSCRLNPAVYSRVEMVPLDGKAGLLDQLVRVWRDADRIREILGWAREALGR